MMMNNSKTVGVFRLLVPCTVCCRLVFK
uniref:Uncharacterized protein n=1 Tax=Anguilla anguilla TaxID=7936 RepID=A0A0E9XNS6_ANGAN